MIGGNVGARFGRRPRMEYRELVGSPSVLLQIDTEAEKDTERRQVVTEESARVDKRNGTRWGTRKRRGRRLAGKRKGQSIKH